MIPTPTTQSIVLIAQDVNQSIFRATWLVRNGIVTEAELDQSEHVYGRGMTLIPTEQFELLVLPDRIQLKVLAHPDPPFLLKRIVSGIVNALPHTPFNAIGVNTEYELKPATPEQFFAWNKAKLACPLAISLTPPSPRVRYGCTFAYDAFEGARVRVRIAVSAVDGQQEPVTATNDGPLLPYMANLHCNVHRNLKEESRVSEVNRMIGLWPAIEAEAHRIARSILE